MAMWPSNYMKKSLDRKNLNEMFCFVFKEKSVNKQGVLWKILHNRKLGQDKEKDECPRIVSAKYKSKRNISDVLTLCSKPHFLPAFQLTKHWTWETFLICQDSFSDKHESK